MATALRKCRICDCHELAACVDERGPCWWVTTHICSHCVPKKLKGRRRQQLRQLLAAGAISRETATCCSLGHDWSPGTLSAMIGEGLTQQAQLPYKGDSKRRLSHYWLTELGQAAAQ